MRGHAAGETEVVAWVVGENKDRRTENSSGKLVNNSSSGGFFKASRTDQSRRLIDESTEDLIQRHSTIRDVPLEETARRSRTRNVRTKVEDV